MKTKRRIAKPSDNGDALELYLHYRPKTLDQVLGQEDTIASIRSLKSIPHAILFTGPSGVGKTTLARILAKHIKCSKHDYMEVNVAETRGIDAVREINDSIGLAPMVGKARMWVLDEVHRSTVDFQSALLKILEDTPRHAYLVLATTDPEKLLNTIRTRCTTFNLKALSDGHLRELVQDVAEKEGKELSSDVTEKIVEAAEGSARKALVILHQVIDLPEEEQMKAVEPPQIKRQAFDLVKVMLYQKPKWEEAAKIIKEVDTSELERLRHFILSVANTELLKANRNSPRASMIITNFSEPFFNTKLAGLSNAVYESCMGN